MNKPQCPKIKTLKRQLKTKPQSEIISLASTIGISRTERGILVEKFCFGSSNTKIAEKFNVDESCASESINRSLQKIVFYLESINKTLEDYKGVIK